MHRLNVNTWSAGKYVFRGSNLKLKGTNTRWPGTTAISRFHSSPFIMRVPFFLIFGFNRQSRNPKPQTQTENEQMGTIEESTSFATTCATVSAVAGGHQARERLKAISLGSPIVIRGTLSSRFPIRTILHGNIPPPQTTKP